MHYYYYYYYYGVDKKKNKRKLKDFASDEGSSTQCGHMSRHGLISLNKTKGNEEITNARKITLKNNVKNKKRSS